MHTDMSMKYGSALDTGNLIFQMDLYDQRFAQFCSVQMSKLEFAEPDDGFLAVNLLVDIRHEIIRHTYVKDTAYWAAVANIEDIWREQVPTFEGEPLDWLNKVAADYFNHIGITDNQLVEVSFI